MYRRASRAVALACLAAGAARATIAPLSPAAMLHDIHVAVAAGAPGYTIPSGLYNFSAYPFLQFTLTAAQNFVLQATPPVLLLFGLHQGIQLVDCVNTTVAGLTVDYAELGFTQGTMSGATYIPGGQGGSLDYLAFTLTLDPLYPPAENITALGYTKCYWYNASSRRLYHPLVETSPVVHNLTRTGSNSAGQLTYRVYAHITEDTAGWHPPLQDGASLVTLSSTTVSGVLVNNCSGTVVQDFTLYHAPAMGYLETGGGGGTIISGWRAVLPPPALPPPLSTPLPPYARLLVSTIDGVHSTSVQRGLALLDSEVGWTGDDAFAVHCELGIAWGPITATNGAAAADADAAADVDASSLWIIDTGGGARTVALAQPGEQLYFFALNATMDPLWVGTVAAPLAPEPNATLQAEAAAAQQEIQRDLNITIRPLGPGSTLLMRVAFTEPIPPAVRPRFSSLVQLPSRCGAGTRVHNCSLHDSSGGMRLKGVSVTVSNSSIARAYGMRMLPEAFWTQSVTFNASILYNTLVDTGNAPAQEDSIAYYNDTCTGLVMEGNTVQPWVPGSR